MKVVIRERERSQNIFIDTISERTGNSCSIEINTVEKRTNVGVFCESVCVVGNIREDDIARKYIAEALWIICKPKPYLIKIVYKCWIIIGRILFQENRILAIICTVKYIGTAERSLIEIELFGYVSFSENGQEEYICRSDVVCVKMIDDSSSVFLPVEESQTGFGSFVLRVFFEKVIATDDITDGNS